jgi:cytochrome b involved in lipid metabolism
MSGEKLFNKESALEHAKSNTDKTFIAIHDVLYDVTEFLDEVTTSTSIIFFFFFCI